MDKEAMPKIKESIPITLGNIKSLWTTFLKYPPGKVIIKIFVIENTVTRKLPAAIVEDFSKLIVIRLFDLYTNKLAVTAMEKPPNKELIIMN